MSLFSICLHFLRCVRSCDKKPNYCRLCSRVCENFLWNVMLFRVCQSVLMELTCFWKNFYRTDLDVFLFGEARYLKDSKNCSLFQVFNYPQELFDAFSAFLVRMYLNSTVGSLSRLLCSVSLADDKKK